MAIESLSKRILNLGLSDEESKYYLFISLMGPIPISNIVRRYNTNRVKVYRSLQKLVEKGFLEKIMGRPVLYIAKPLDEIFKNSIENLQKKIVELETSREDTLSEWNKINEGMEKLIEEPRFRIHQGRNQVYNILINMCEKAENEVLFITTESDLNRLALYGFDEHIKKIAQKGIQFNFITQVESIDFEEIGDYYHFASMRHVPLPSPVRIIVVDNSDVLVTVQMDDSMSMNTQNDTGLWTNAQSFVSVMNIFFQSLWKLASDVPAVLFEMKTGTKLQEIVTLRSRDEFLDYVSKSIKRCSSSFDLILNSHDSVLLTMIKKVHQSTIESRIITHITLNNINFYNDFTDFTQIRHNSSLTGMYLIIIDKTELIVSLPSWQDRTQSVWSNNIYYVDSMQHIFNENWERSESMNDVIKKLQKEEKTIKLMKQIKLKLYENEYVVESPGIIDGVSGTRHVFGLVAYRKDVPESIIGIDSLGKKEQMSQISLMGAKRTDLNKMKIIMISNNSPNRQVVELAKLFRIQIINETQFLKEIENIIIENR